MARGAGVSAGKRHRVARLGGALALAAAGACALLGYAGTGAPDKPGDVTVVFPQARTVTFYGNFDLIAKAASGKLTVDGRPQAWERFQAPVRVKHLGLEPGAHQLEIDGRRLDVFVSLGPDEHDWPRGWSIVYSHPMETGPNRCGYCHKTSDQAGQVVVGPWKGHQACQECHRADELAAIHAHPLEPLHDCSKCHGIHGSPEKELFRQPVKKLCSACHDA